MVIPAVVLSNKVAVLKVALVAPAITVAELLGPYHCQLVLAAPLGEAVKEGTLPFIQMVDDAGLIVGVGGKVVFDPTLTVTLVV